MLFQYPATSATSFYRLSGSTSQCYEDWKLEIMGSDLLCKRRCAPQANTWLLGVQDARMGDNVTESRGKYGGSNAPQHRLSLAVESPAQ